MELFTELKRRKVFRVAVVYAATAFAVLQGADILLPNLGVPDWTMRFLVVLVVLGFPIALVLAWALELKPDGGIQRAEAVQAANGESPPALLGTRTLVVAGLLVALGIGLSAGWLLKPDTGPGSTGTADTARIGNERQSVAVLPFVNMSADPENEYFADGLNEEILNSLNALPDLLVTARTSSFFYKDKDVPVDKIAARLGVEHILEGSVRRSGERLRVTAQLVRASDGFHLWSNTYDAQLEDIFQIQTDVAEKVAGALSIYLDEDQREAISASGTRNVEAFKASLRGQSLFNRAHANEPGVSLWDANEEFERAMALDPNYVAPAIRHHDAFAHYLMDGPDARILKEPGGRAPASEEEARRRLLADLDRAIDNARTPTERIVAQLYEAFFPGHGLVCRASSSSCANKALLSKQAPSMSGSRLFSPSTVNSKRCARSTITS